ncbi:MAG: hypothetical protein KIT09_12580 [Bryobacteraceae bacterium]|nr:hypothetical protein [Bryobacteraceae bacterium]
MSESRREFMRLWAAGMAGSAVLPAQPSRILILDDAEAGFKRRLAARELLRGLTRLVPGKEVRLADGSARPGRGDLVLALRIQPDRFREPEAYAIWVEPERAVLAGGGEQAILYAVFDFLERQGIVFGIDGESLPFDPPGEVALPAMGAPWEASPRFAARGLLPWPDFLNCITVFNEEDFRSYFEAMLRMRFNTFGMHAYTGGAQWAESYLSFEYAGAGHLAFLDTTASHRWGYLPQRTSRFGMGAAQLYDSEVFGSDATRLGRDPWEIAERSRRLLQDAFAYAAKLGIRTGIGFEPYQIPDEILRALPPEVRAARTPERGAPGPRFDMESVTARDLLETRLGQLLDAYPEVDHVWLWEDEQMNWDSRKTGQPLSPTPFLAAHNFLRRHAPKKRLVLAGWGGVARHFAHFHKALPGDVIFTCLSDSLGWDPVHEAFGRLEDRERWPIPWLEDDPGMWLTQLHAHRFESDLNRAIDFGCQGLLGIHWRHRIVDPTAIFQARFSWDGSLKPADHYRAYARTQAAGERAGKLADILTAADRDRTLLSTWTGEIKDGHAETREFSGDYSEAFTFWADYEPDPKVAASQKEVAASLRALADGAATPLERERLDYLAGHVGFLVPYTEAWILAHRLHGVLKAADELRKAGRKEDARSKVAAEGVPLWLKLAPEVRAAMLRFQRIVATRNDLGTLASKHNKFIRLALVRLRLSIKEFLGELPEETEKAFAEAIAPDAEARPRLFVPTRPTMLARGETVRVMVVTTGEAPVRGVFLHTRAHGAKRWTATPAKHLGRRTYEARLTLPAGSAALAEYYFSADVGSEKLVAPPEGAYLVTAC